MKPYEVWMLKPHELIFVKVLSNCSMQDIDYIYNQLWFWQVHVTTKLKKNKLYIVCDTSEELDLILDIIV